MGMVGKALSGLGGGSSSQGGGGSDNPLISTLQVYKSKLKIYINDHLSLEEKVLIHLLVFGLGSVQEVCWRRWPHGQQLPCDMRRSALRTRSGPASADRASQPAS